MQSAFFQKKFYFSAKSFPTNYVYLSKSDSRSFARIDVALTIFGDFDHFRQKYWRFYSNQSYDCIFGLYVCRVKGVNISAKFFFTKILDFVNIALSDRSQSQNLHSFRRWCLCENRLPSRVARFLLGATFPNRKNLPKKIATTSIAWPSKIYPK
jgi:hypothetical protein